MTTENNIEKETVSDSEAGGDCGATTCSPSSESPPTQHPSGAWCRSDYASQFEKLRDHLKAVVGGSFYGHSTGYFHCDPKAMRAARAHLDSLENAKDLRPAESPEITD